IAEEEGNSKTNEVAYRAVQAGALAGDIAGGLWGKVTGNADTRDRFNEVNQAHLERQTIDEKQIAEQKAQLAALNKQIAEAEKAFAAAKDAMNSLAQATKAGADGVADPNNKRRGQSTPVRNSH